MMAGAPGFNTRRSSLNAICRRSGSTMWYNGPHAQPAVETAVRQDGEIARIGTARSLEREKARRLGRPSWRTTPPPARGQPARPHSLSAEARACTGRDLRRCRRCAPFVGSSDPSDAVWSPSPNAGRGAPGAPIPAPAVDRNASVRRRSWLGVIAYGDGERMAHRQSWTIRFFATYQHAIGCAESGPLGRCQQLNDTKKYGPHERSQDGEQHEHGDPRGSKRPA